MNTRVKMRKTLLLIIVLLLGMVSINAQSPALFKDSTRRGAPSGENAIRARYAEIDFGVLGQNEIALNLFTDATYYATHLRTEARPSGEPGYVWIGILPEERFSDVVLVVTPDGIHGQVNTLSRLFAIETAQPQLVLITENREHHAEDSDI